MSLKKIALGMLATTLIVSLSLGGGCAAEES